MKCCIALICSLLLSTQAHGAQPAVLIGPDLEPKAVNLDEVSLADEGLIRLRLNSGLTAPLNDKQYVARLVDGQTLVGTLLGVGEGGESIRLAFGYEQRTVVLPLDELLSFTLVGHSLASDASDDMVLLATGEKLVGFVDSVGKDSIGFVVGDADDPIQIPMERIRGFSIANKPEPVKVRKGLVRVQLRGGSLLYLRDASMKRVEGKADRVLEGTFILEPETAPIALPLNYVQLIEPVSDRYALHSLTAFEMATVDGGEVFGVKMPPKAEGQGRIRLHAPTTLGFDLPKGASRVAFTAALDLGEDIPDARRKLAGCELIVYDGDERIGGCTLTHAGPPQRLNLPLTGGQLRIELDPGVNGPVLDRVVLTDAELLVSEQ